MDEHPSLPASEQTIIGAKIKAGCPATMHSQARHYVDLASVPVPSLHLFHSCYLGFPASKPPVAEPSQALLLEEQELRQHETNE